MVVVTPNGHLKYSTSKLYSEHGVLAGQRWAGTLINHQWGPWELVSGHVCAHNVSEVSTLQVGGRTTKAVGTLWVSWGRNCEEAEIAARGQQDGHGLDRNREVVMMTTSFCEHLWSAFHPRWQTLSLLETIMLICKEQLPVSSQDFKLWQRWVSPYTPQSFLSAPLICKGLTPNTL